MLNNRDEIQTSESTEEVVRYSVYEGIIKSATLRMIFGLSKKPIPPKLTLEIEVHTGNLSRSIIKYEMEECWTKIHSKYIDPLHGMKVKLYVTHLKNSSIIKEIELIEDGFEIFMYEGEERFLSTWKHKNSK